MQYVKHPQHTRYLGKPIDWNEATQGECGALSIKDMRKGPNPMMESAWAFDDTTWIGHALGGATVRLAVYGTMHPPVSMATEWNPEWYTMTTDQKREKYEAALQALIDHAQSNGVSLTRNGILL